MIICFKYSPLDHNLPPYKLAYNEAEWSEANDGGNAPRGDTGDGGSDANEEREGGTAVDPGLWYGEYLCA